MITGGPTGVTNDARPAFTFTAAGGSTVECSIDTGSAGFGPCSGAAAHQPASDLADGDYTFRVRATDGAGNAATQTRSFTVDTTAPSLSITGGPAGTTSDAVRASTSTPRPARRSSARSTRERPASAPARAPPATSRPRTSRTAATPSEVRATDAAGNSVTRTRGVHGRRRLHAADALDHRGPTGTTSDHRPTFTFDAEAGATVQCSIDTGTASFGSCSGASSHQPAADLVDGSYTFRVRATDAARQLGDPDAGLHRRLCGTVALDHRRSHRRDQRRSPGLHVHGLGRLHGHLLDRHRQRELRPVLGRRQPSAGHRPGRRRLHLPGAGDRRCRELGDSDPELQRRHRRADRCRSPAARPGRPATPVRRSASPPARVRQWSARSTPAAPASVPARAPPATSRPPTWPTAPTRSACGRPTRPATRRPRPATSASTPCAPTLSITGGPSGPTSDQRPRVQLQPPVRARPGGVLDRPGTANFGACSGAAGHQPASDLSDGAHTFRVRATDGAGNAATADPQLHASTPPPPSLSITGGPAGPTNDPRRPSPFTARCRLQVACSVDTGTPAYGPAPALEPSAGGRPRRRPPHLPGAGDRRSRQCDHADPSPSASTPRPRRCRSRVARRATTTDVRPGFDFSARARRARSSARSTPGPRASAPARAPPAISRAPPRRRPLHLPGPGHRRGRQPGDPTRGFTVDIDTTPPTLSIDSAGRPAPPATPARRSGSAAEAGATVQCSIDTGTANFGACSGASSHTARLRSRRRRLHVPRPGDRRGRQLGDPTRALHRRPAAPSLTITGGPRALPTTPRRPSPSRRARADHRAARSIRDRHFGPCSGATAHARRRPRRRRLHLPRPGDRRRRQLGDPTRTFTVDTVAPTPAITAARRARRARPRRPSTSRRDRLDPRVLDRHRQRRASAPARAPPSHHRPGPRQRQLHLPRPRHRRRRQRRRPRRRPSASTPPRPRWSITGGPTGRPTTGARASPSRPRAARPRVLDRHRQGELRPLFGRREPQPAAELARRRLHLPGPGDRRRRQLGDPDPRTSPSTPRRRLTIDSAARPGRPATRAPASTSPPRRAPGLQCSIDTGTATSAPAPAPASHEPTSDLADGGYTFRVRATDAAGNSTTQTRGFSVDTTAPRCRSPAVPTV